VLKGFGLNIIDREAIPNNILLYPDFTLDTLPKNGEPYLKHVTLEPYEPGTLNGVKFTLSQPDVRGSKDNEVPI